MITMKSSSPSSPSHLFTHSNHTKTPRNPAIQHRIPAKKITGTTKTTTAPVNSQSKSPHVAKQHCGKTLSALLLHYANTGLISDAQATWDELIYSEYIPSIQVVSSLMDAYGRIGCFDQVIKVLHAVVSKNNSKDNSDMCSKAYSSAISCFGKLGEGEMMECVLKEMITSGLKVDSSIGNTLLKYYSEFGSLTDMEVAYGKLRRSRVLVEKEGIRAVAKAYINEKKFYKLGEFVRSVGLGRRKDGNLLWNLLLLSYAANFKMKSLQREFLRMVEAGFSPDLDTFNIRMVAFSKMSLFWDLHVSLEHMRHENVNPDIVTYGCVVDAFLDRRLGKNLNFALNKMNTDDSPLALTDSLVFEIFGKGDFHSSSEAFLEYKLPRTWTYRELIRVYLKKKYRSNQIFWNY